MEAFITLLLASTMALVTVAIVADRAASSVPNATVSAYLAAQKGAQEVRIAVEPSRAKAHGSVIVDDLDDDEAMPARTVPTSLADRLADRMADQDSGFEGPDQPTLAEQLIDDRLADWSADRVYADPLNKPEPAISEERLAIEARRLQFTLDKSGSARAGGAQLASLDQDRTDLLDDTPTGSLPPMIDRTLSFAEKKRDLSPDLVTAILRIEPMFDPVHTVDTADALSLRIWAGTASTTTVFGDRWHLASDDPTINMRTASFGLVWRATADLSCASFNKIRSYDASDVTLDGLSLADCLRLQARLQQPRHDAAPIALAAATFDPPTFAAPLPGARQTSDQFWAAQRAKVLAIEARLHGKWTGAGQTAN